MALYDGFFDADPDTGEYDRDYASESFTEYFHQFIGSGVCVHENPDSFLVRLEGGAAVVSPGYLFIQGYWLKNDGEYSVALEGTGPFAVLAHLNTGKRMIELEARAAAESYPDSLVLALVDGGAVTDTRRDRDLCGVVDSAGGLSQKVEWAVHYIDNEIDAKLAQVEKEIGAQAVKLDGKIAEVGAVVEKIAPPPVGSIKFSAAQNVGEGWLRCDGSFINETDYPELVEALGKLTPGVEDFREILGAVEGEQVSNHCIVDGTVWIYMVGSKKLIGISNSDRKEIIVNGAESIVENPGIDVVLSICGGAMYLAQNNYSGDTFVLLECAVFSPENADISMTALDVSSKISVVQYNNCCVPKVTSIAGKCYIVVGTTAPVRTTGNNGVSSYSNGLVKILEWVSGFFSGAKAYSFDLVWGGLSSNTNLYNALLSLLSFHTKNANDLLLAFSGINYYYTLSAGQNNIFYICFDIGSYIQSVYGAIDTSNPIQISEKLDKLKENIWFNRYVIEGYIPQLNIIPVGAKNEVLYEAEIVSHKMDITFANYNTNSLPAWKTIAIQLPSRATLFKESVVYASSQGLWFIFVGTGLLFTESLEDGSWGYLDTTAFLGTITRFGCLDYDADKNILYISGTDTTGKPVVGKFVLPDLYSYANDGAWLPMIASDGVPAYIKAKEDT